MRVSVWSQTVLHKWVLTLKNFLCHIVHQSSTLNWIYVAVEQKFVQGLEREREGETGCETICQCPAVKSVMSLCTHFISTHVGSFSGCMLHLTQSQLHGCWSHHILIPFKAWVWVVSVTSYLIWFFFLHIFCYFNAWSQNLSFFLCEILMVFPEENRFHAMRSK